MRAGILVLGTVLCGGVLLSLAQQAAAPGSSWYTMIFLKVPGDKTPAYEEAIRTQLAKVAQSRVESGELTGWAHHKLLLPGGTESKYNYALVYDHAGVPKLDPPAAETEQQWAKAGVTRGDFADRMNTLGVAIVRRVLWRGLDRVGSLEAGDFMRLDMVTNNAPYTSMERTVFKPYWEERIRTGAMKAWGLYAMSIPGGEDRPGSFLTMQGFRSEQQMLEPPRATARETWAKVAEVPQTTATELWRVVEVGRAGR